MCTALAAAGPADLVLPADGAVCGNLGQPFAAWGETAGLGKVQALVGLLSLKRGCKSGREQGVGDVAITTHLC